MNLWKKINTMFKFIRLHSCQQTQLHLLKPDSKILTVILGFQPDSNTLIAAKEPEPIVTKGTVSEDPWG